MLRQLRTVTIYIANTILLILNLMSFVLPQSDLSRQPENLFFPQTKKNALALFFSFRYKAWRKSITKILNTTFVPPILLQ